MSVFVDAFRFTGDNLSLLWTKTIEHLELSGAAIAVAVVIAVPLGLWLGHRHRGSFLAINVANIGRALPSLAVIAIGLAVLGIGFVNVMVALVVLAVPPILTNAYLAVDQVDRDTVLAAEGMGMRPRQVFARVELPMSLPLLFAGIRTSAVYVVATATLAAIAGGGGLGDIIVNQASYRLAGVVAGAIWVAALALLVDLAFGALQRVVTPRGLRRAAKAAGMPPPPDVGAPAPAVTARPVPGTELN
jgi:osmoprotectant transport system permease protein